MTTVAELAAAGVGTLVGEGAVVVRGVRHDSRVVEAGDLFVAIRGGTRDAAEYVPAAIDSGAVAVVAERRLDVDVPLLVSDDPRAALARASAIVYQRPTAKMKVVGITGTNGKTTTAWLLESILLGVGRRPALMGTVAFRGPGFEAPAPFTTPEADDIDRFAQRALDAGATELVMEVSSHGLSQRRADGVAFAVAAFTNLTRDHLDFHRDFEDYGAAKARLFLELDPAVAVINVDDGFGADLAARVPMRCLRVSARPGADAELVATAWSMDRAGLSMTVSTPVGDISVASPLLGVHNVENLLVALGCAHALGVDLAAAASALASATGAPGRLERVDDPRDVAVLVDYAHTPDALANALRALRPVTPGRLVCVFGCGGDRDPGKRPVMGEAAARGADLCVVTSDNPRTEDPAAIVADILPGVAATGAVELDPVALRSADAGYVVEADRERAIFLAITAARPGDTVLLAGKGHEDYQIVGTEKRDFDDREHARRAIAAAGEGSA